jgi:dienelactone hydrolase
VFTALDWPYRDLDTPLTGVLCRDEARPGARPGVLLVHGGAGLDDHARAQARRYAALGYIVLACDMLGDGVAGHRDRVIGCLRTLRDDPPLTVRRARAGLAALSRCPDTDGRVAAVGFCFGGLVALALALQACVRRPADRGHRCSGTSPLTCLLTWSSSRSDTAE